MRRRGREEGEAKKNSNFFLFFFRHRHPALAFSFCIFCISSAASHAGDFCKMSSKMIVFWQNDK